MEALEANEASDDELEAEYQEAVPSTIILKQRRAGKPPSSEDHKAELDKREQKLPCAQGRQPGQWKGGYHCLAKVKRVNWAGRLPQVSRRALHGHLCVWVLQPGELETLVWFQ